jgi:hypothetical protein
MNETREEFRHRLEFVYFDKRSTYQGLEAVYAEALRDVMQELIPYVIGGTMIDTELLVEWAAEKGIDLSDEVQR